MLDSPYFGSPTDSLQLTDFDPAGIKKGRLLASPFFLAAQLDLAAILNLSKALSR